MFSPIEESLRLPKDVNNQAELTDVNAVQFRRSVRQIGYDGIASYMESIERWPRFFGQEIGPAYSEIGNLENSRSLFHAGFRGISVV